MLIGGVNALMNFNAEPLTQLVSRLPAGPTSVPSRVTLAAEFAMSKPPQGESRQALRRIVRRLAGRAQHPAERSVLVLQ